MNYLKSILIALIFSFNVGTVSSQYLDFQFGAGVGSSYLIEVWQGGTNMNYYASQSYSAALRLAPDSSYFNLKILFQHVSTISRKVLLILIDMGKLQVSLLLL